MRNPFGHPEELNEVVWGPIEDNFQHTKGDVLEIFDCCYAGDLGRTRQPWSTRSFEFLGACSSGNVTLSPGEGSFTTALIWALGSLLEEQTRFTVSELSCKIRNAPGFPRDQVPVQLDRGVHAIQRIMLAPLPEPSNDAESHTPEPPSTEAQGLLNLNFFLDEPPTQKTVKKFAQALSRFMWQEKMPVNRIVWGGLTSWGGTQPSAKVNAQKLAVAKMFRRALDRKNTRVTRPRRRSYQSGIRTPVSDVPLSAPEPSILKASEIVRLPNRRTLGSHQRTSSKVALKGTPVTVTAQTNPAQPPKFRSNTTEAKVKDRPEQRWKEKGKKVLMRKSHSEPYDYIMFVNDWKFNEDRQGWDYELKNEDGIKYGSWVKETDTQRA
ncbi:MAG: hypothetical protein Q9222_003765 [Ikaeria aurantiellina]